MFFVKGWPGKWLLAMFLLAFCLVLGTGHQVWAAETLAENDVLEEQAGIEEQTEEEGTIVAQEVVTSATVTVKVYNRHNLLLAEQVTLGKGELTLPGGQVYRYDHPTALAALALALEQKGIP